MKKKKAIQRGATPLKERRQFSMPELKLPLWIAPAFLGLVCAGVIYQGLGHISFGWPVKEVDIEGEFRYWEPEALGRELLWIRERNFFTLDVEKAREHLEALPLIRSAFVRKQWPGQVVIRVREDIPVAVWNNKQLLNTEGRELILPEGFDYGSLPHLTGPEEKAEDVMRNFQRFQLRLNTAGIHVRALGVSSVGSWKLELNNGWVVSLGRQQLEQRIQKLAVLLNTLPAEKVAEVDLRYSRGAAIRWLSV